MDKKKIKAVLRFSSSDRARELIRYSVFKTYGLMQTGAIKQLGFEGMNDTAERVEKCIEAAQSIQEAIKKLSLLQNKALLTAVGLEAETSSSKSYSDINSQSELVSSSSMQLPSFNTLKEVLQHGQYNWFAVVDFIEQEAEITPDSVMEIHIKRNFIHLH